MELEKFISTISDLPDRLKVIESSINDFNKRLEKIENTIYYKVLSKKLREKWIPIEDVVTQLNISRRKLDYLRAQRKITYHQTGKHIFISGEDFERYMEEHKVERNNQNES